MAFTLRRAASQHVAPLLTSARPAVPEGHPDLPARDQLIEHLERHAGEDGIEFRLGTGVDRIDRGEGEWVVQTSAGELRAPQVILALGHEQNPFIPDWPGRADFEGTLIHSAEYRNAGPFDDQRVLVVGPGSSGMEIAHELAENGAAKVWLAVRTPPNILLRQGPGSVPGDLIATWLWHLPTGLADRIARFASRMDVGDFSEYGFARAEHGVFTDVRTRGKVPAIVDADVIEAIKDGPIEVVGAVQSARRRWGPGLADGMHLDPQSVICATGYRRALEPLVGHLGVLGERGLPRKGIGPEGRPWRACASSAISRVPADSATWPRRRSEPPRRSPASCARRPPTVPISRFRGPQR